jgi:hypothetical protein
MAHSQRVDGLEGQRRKIRTGPLPQVSWSSLEPAFTIEHRLPRLFLIAFALLVAIQVWLHL